MTAADALEKKAEMESRASLFDDVVKRVGEYLEADVSHLTPDSRLVTALPGIDSLTMFEMILYLEDCFGVAFEEAVIEKIDSMEDLTGYIQELIRAQQPVNA